MKSYAVILVVVLAQLAVSMPVFAQDDDVVVLPAKPAVKPGVAKPAAGKPATGKPGAAKPAPAEAAPVEEAPAAGQEAAPAAEEPKPANTNVTGKLKTPKLALIATKTVPKVQCNYGYEIKTTEPRIRKPIVAFYFVVQGPDGTREFSKGYDRKGSLAEKSEVFTYDIMKVYSEKEPTVPTKDVRAVLTHFEDIPFIDKRGFMQLVLFRFELWVDGVMLDSYDSKPPTSWKQMKIPDDWYKHDHQNTVL
jgi:hypothetical protein